MRDNEQRLRADLATLPKFKALKDAMDRLREHRRKWSVDPGDSFEVEGAATTLIKAVIGV